MFVNLVSTILIIAAIIIAVLVLLYAGAGVVLVITSIISTIMEIPFVGFFIFPAVGQIFIGTPGLIGGIVLYALLIFIRIKRGQ